MTIAEQLGAADNPLARVPHAILFGFVRPEKPAAGRVIYGGDPEDTATTSPPTPSKRRKPSRNSKATARRSLVVDLIRDAGEMHILDIMAATGANRSTLEADIAWLRRERRISSERRTYNARLMIFHRVQS